MHFFPLILASIFAAAATTALPHDNLNGLSLRQDSSCAAAMSSEEAARKKDYAAAARYKESPSHEALNQAYEAKIDLHFAEDYAVSVVVVLRYIQS